MNACFPLQHALSTTVATLRRILLASGCRCRSLIRSICRHNRLFNPWTTNSASWPRATSPKAKILSMLTIGGILIKKCLVCKSPAPKSLRRSAIEAPHTIFGGGLCSSRGSSRERSVSGPAGFQHSTDAAGKPQHHLLDFRAKVSAVVVSSSSKTSLGGCWHDWKENLGHGTGAHCRPLPPPALPNPTTQSQDRLKGLQLILCLVALKRKDNKAAPKDYTIHRPQPTQGTPLLKCRHHLKSSSVMACLMHQGSCLTPFH